VLDGAKLAMLAVYTVPPPLGKVTDCPLARYHPVGMVLVLGSSMMPLVGIGLSRNVVVMVILALP